MGAMSMNKVVHGAVRRDLDRFVDALADFPAGDQRRADELQRAWTHFADQLRQHHEGEHEIAWPALAQIGVGPEVLAAMDAEHGTMSHVMTTAGEAMSALVHKPGIPQAAHACAAVQRLREVTAAHLDHEEDETEELYLAHRDHPAIVGMDKPFAQGGPARAGRFLTWLLDGASADEREAIRGSVPGPVLTVLTGTFGRRYRRTIAPVWTR